MPTEVHDHAAAAGRMCDVAVAGELHVVSPMFPGQPDALLAALITESARRGIALVLYTADLSGRYEFAAGLDLAAAGTRIVTIGGRVPTRLAPVIDYLPIGLYEVDRSFADGRIRVDVFVAQVAAPDTDGYCSFGPVVSYSPSALGAARLVVLEVNETFPRLTGHRGAVLDDADVVVRAGVRGIGELPVASTNTPVEARIGALLAGLIPDGATVQLGIGAIPERFLAALAGHQRLRIHSGAIPEAAIDLIDAGVFTGAAHVTTSLLGTRKLYEYAADQRNRIRVEPTSMTHAPTTLMDVGPLFSVNSAFEVDLTGQVNAEYFGGRKRASAGGQSDFGRWAHLTGANIIALRAARGAAPSIVGTLSAPYAVTTHRSDLDYVVTEFGVAALRSKTLRQRAEALARIVAPEHRERTEAALATAIAVDTP